MATFHGAVKVLWWSCFVVLYCKYCTADQGRYITDESYTYIVNYTNGTPCLVMSFNAHFVISYNKVNRTNQSNPIFSVERQIFDLPNKTLTTVDGDCSDDNTYRLLSLTWPEGDNDTFTLTFSFTVERKEWYLSQVGFEFELNNDTFEMPKETGYQSYQTTEGVKFFNRTFSSNQYFYCKACKKLFLRVQDADTGNGTGPCFVVPDKKNNGTNSTVCSFLQLSNSVIYPGNVSSENIKKKLCLEDFIELQEIIIPSVVGGVLGLLLFLIFTSYLIAFVRRKRREGRYESLNDGVY